ncbi:MAG: hypothetical protein QW727_02230 [Candidatus Pacearchaeota archaeon]
MKILEKKQNLFLDREELLVELESKSIPSKIEIIKKISEELNKPEENIIIEKIISNFGRSNFKISAKIYNNQESRKKYETISRKEKKKIFEEKKKVEKAKKTESENK